jgi:hypothetical protein
MNERSPRSPWILRLGAFFGVLVVVLLLGKFLISRADGPIFIFSGGPFRSGEMVELADLEWDKLDALHELELEIVGGKNSLTLWFSVEEGIPYVACDLDCVGGRLMRWPQQIELDNRVVVRIDGKRAVGRLVHVPHGTVEYQNVRAGREKKYSGTSGGRAAAETAAHSTVVEVGEALTGRSRREEPGDRLFRIEPR